MSAGKFIVAVDCEGIACGVGSPDGGLNSSRNLEYAQLQATREADAAARALFDAGASQVIIWDNHNGSLNLHYDLLDERCDIALGVGLSGRFPEMDDTFSGLVFIGYHARSNTIDGVMSHTYSSQNYQYVKFNGVEVGEMAIDGAVAGKWGVPVCFIASDDRALAEAAEFFPWAETVQTKTGKGWNAAVSKHPARAVKEVYAGVKKAVARLEEMKAFTFKEPIAVEIRFTRNEGAETISRRVQGWERVDAYTVRGTLESAEAFFQSMG